MFISLNTLVVLFLHFLMNAFGSSFLNLTIFNLPSLNLIDYAPSFAAPPTFFLVPTVNPPFLPQAPPVPRVSKTLRLVFFL